MRRIARLALLATGLSFPALAQDLPQTITGDIDGDGVLDRVELRANATDGDQVDVAITLSASKRTVSVSELIATQAVLPSAIDKGELHLSFGWYQGRYKSSTDFYIGLQGQELVVRRYKTAIADSITEDKDGVLVKTCEADFAANRATVDDKPAAPPGPPIPLAAWRGYDSVPKACQSLF
jgi:hypothetical protein